MNDNGGTPDSDLLVAQLGGSIVLLAAYGRPVRDVVGEVEQAHRAAAEGFERMTDEDFDGFGVLYCPTADGGCGFCKHASRDDGVCGFCGDRRESS